MHGDGMANTEDTTTGQVTKGAGSKVVVVGAGAMGSLFAARFAQTGYETWVYDVWAEHVERIREFGLSVRSGDAEEAIPMHATTDPREPGVADLVLMFVKHHQTRQAARDIAPAVGPATVVLTLQNGLGNVEQIREAFPRAALLFGFTTLTSELLGPGRIEASFAGRGETCVWSTEGVSNDACGAAVDLLKRSGINATVDPEIELHIWEKLVVNCCLNTLCAISGLSVGALVDQPEAWLMLDGITDEIVAVAVHKDIALTREIARGFLRDVAEKARAHYPSMLRDIRAEKQTEIECLNGAIIREAERFGIDVPFNRFAYAMIRTLENTYAHRQDTEDSRKFLGSRALGVHLAK
jgi:2-dehydropantoate 2-reductase